MATETGKVSVLGWGLESEREWELPWVSGWALEWPMGPVWRPKRRAGRQGTGHGRFGSGDGKGRGHGKRGPDGDRGKDGGCVHRDRACDFGRGGGIRSR